LYFKKTSGNENLNGPHPKKTRANLKKLATTNKARIHTATIVTPKPSIFLPAHKFTRPEQTRKTHH